MAVLLMPTAGRNKAKKAKDSHGGNFLSLFNQVVTFSYLQCACVYSASCLPGVAHEQA